MHLIAHRDELLILLKQIRIPVNVHEDRRRFCARARGRGRLFALCGGLEQIYPGGICRSLESITITDYA